MPIDAADPAAPNTPAPDLAARLAEVEERLFARFSEALSKVPKVEAAPPPKVEAVKTTGEDPRIAELIARADKAESERATAIDRSIRDGWRSEALASLKDAAFPDGMIAFLERDLAIVDGRAVYLDATGKRLQTFDEKTRAFRDATTEDRVAALRVAHPNGFLATATPQVPAGGRGSPTSTAPAVGLDLQAAFDAIKRSPIGHKITEEAFMRAANVAIPRASAAMRRPS